MRRLLTTVLVVGALFCVAACSRKTDDTAIRAKVANLLSKTPFTPAPQHPLDVQFGDSISLIGYDVDTEKAEAGKPVHITWYYKVNKSPGADWMQFTHIADGKNVSRINLDHNGPLRQGWTAGHWEAGSYVKDPQTITLPSDWDSDKLVVFLGFWKANERLDVTKGPKDDRSARVRWSCRSRVQSPSRYRSSRPSRRCRPSSSTASSTSRCGARHRAATPSSTP